MFKKISRKTEYKIVVIIILLILIPLLIFLPPAIERVKVRQTFEDMKKIANAVESWSIDNSHYPYTDNYFKTGERFLNEYYEKYITDDYEDIAKGAYILPYGNPAAPDAIYNYYNRGLLRDYARLTTPIAYLNEAPIDPFSREEEQHYRYGIHPVGGGPWIIVSNGPDGDEDLDVNLFGLHTGRQTASNYYDSVHYGYEKPLIEYKYDPTNGMKSNGDIIRTRQ
jgi:hypothetical protein